MQLPKNITFATSTIADGNMSLRFGEAADVIANRNRYVGHTNYLAMRCDHGSVIAFVHDVGQQSIDAEVVVTQTPHLTLMLLTADCLPTLFYDEQTRTIALAHFSRQTIAAELPQKTVGFLRHHVHIDPANLQIFVGPHIQPQSYCFLNTNEAFAPTVEPFVKRTAEKVCVDLPAALRAQLTAASVHQEHIHYSPIDTFSSREHFSHFESTRDDTKPHGRLATIASLA